MRKVSSWSSGLLAAVIHDQKSNFSAEWPAMALHFRAIVRMIGSACPSEDTFFFRYAEKQRDRFLVQTVYFRTGKIIFPTFADWRQVCIRVRATLVSRCTDADFRGTFKNLFSTAGRGTVNRKNGVYRRLIYPFRDAPRDGRRSGQARLQPESCFLSFPKFSHLRGKIRRAWFTISSVILLASKERPSPRKRKCAEKPGLWFCKLTGQDIVLGEGRARRERLRRKGAASLRPCLR